MTAIRAITRVQDADDVAVSSPSDGQGLLWNATDGKWENTTLTAAKVGALAASSTLHGIAAANANDGDVALNSHKLTGLAAATANGDAVRFEQLPAAAATLGRSSLVYRYTVTGASKASIDTGVDTPDAGSNDWTNGDLLEVLLYARTDEATVRSSIVFRVNNDSGANYDFQSLYVINTSIASDGPLLAQTSWLSNVNGASAAANFFSIDNMRFPAYTNTVGYKRGDFQQQIGDSTAANVLTGVFTVGYRSTAAISRFSITPATSGKKFVVGTQLLIYKRLAS